MSEPDQSLPWSEAVVLIVGLLAAVAMVVGPCFAVAWMMRP